MKIEANLKLTLLLLSGSLIMAAFFSASGQEKDKPLADDERLKMFNIVSAVQSNSVEVGKVRIELENSDYGKKISELQKQFNELNDKLQKSDLGKKLEAANKELQVSQGVLNRQLKSMQDSHGAAGKCFTPSLAWVDPGKPEATICTIPGIPGK